MSGCKEYPWWSDPTYLSRGIHHPPTPSNLEEDDPDVRDQVVSGFPETRIWRVRWRSTRIGRERPETCESEPTRVSVRDSKRWNNRYRNHIPTGLGVDTVEKYHPYLSSVLTPGTECSGGSKRQGLFRLRKKVDDLGLPKRDGGGWRRTLCIKERRLWIS